MSVLSHAVSRLFPSSRTSAYASSTSPQAFALAFTLALASSPLP